VLPEQGNIAVHLAEASDHIALDVLDDGPGIMAENQAQIFERFFSQRAGGVGLGLAVVKQLVEAHDGEIHYQASPMGGAQFCIRLPKVASAAGKQSSSKM
jgi:two-component system sensor histidine kinase HydH